jgi:hypothetical protein
MASKANQSSASSRNGRKRNTGGRSTSARSASARSAGAPSEEAMRGKRMADSLNSRFGNVAEGATRLKRSMQAGGRRIERSVSGAVEENTLMVGAALFVAGAAVGYAMRGLLRDNMWLEEQRDAVKSKAKEIARTASDKVGNITHKQNRSGDIPEQH